MSQSLTTLLRCYGCVRTSNCSTRSNRKTCSSFYDRWCIVEPFVKLFIAIEQILRFKVQKHAPTGDACATHTTCRITSRDANDDCLISCRSNWTATVAETLHNWLLLISANGASRLVANGRRWIFNARRWRRARPQPLNLRRITAG